MSAPANLIGERLRVARLAHHPKLTQVKLATLLQLEGIDLTQVQISKIEQRARPVSDFEVAAISKLLKVSASWLLGETNNPQPIESENDGRVL
ncbi:MAG: helix-turn-helix transcriptional regulator [Chloroflexota bacterium]